jgi:glycogen debranching enzyme
MTGLSDVICVANRFYVLAGSSRLDDRTRVLKDGETFAVFDRYGDIAPVGFGDLGLYHEGTRFLSRLHLTVDGERPLILSSTVKEDNSGLAVNLTNPDLCVDGDEGIRRGTLHIARELFVWRSVCYERLRVTNYGRERVTATINLQLEADFADLFELRGVRRELRGETLAPQLAADGLVVGYRGLDGPVRRTRITCVPAPSMVSASGIELGLQLEAGAETSYLMTVACETGEARARPLAFEDASRSVRAGLAEHGTRQCTIETSNEQFNDWLSRSFADLSLMVTETPYGPYPYAGVPWFNTPFGRDGIITALETLWVDPGVARGVLTYLAATQADYTDDRQDAQPGKILHESRLGEMAALGEVPFGRYYGSVDATPLFVMLAGAYYRRTGDRELLERLWPNVERALAWMDTAGDVDGDGFLEYYRRSPDGLVHQGWKDSHDSVFHADGTPAEGPIALCEVQGYAYASRRAGARLARALGREDRAETLTRQAEQLKRSFEGAFWCEELDTYALALDGQKRRCQVRTSNPGHCLWTGIAHPARARRVMHSLLAPESFSGWGVRTVAATQIRYNPMSYHNGSVWPHDTALVAAGFARYGFRRGALKLLTGMFDASLFVDLHRLPELFCGFERRSDEGPTLYPVACSPQAWATAVPMLLLASCLGLSISAERRRLRLARPILPPSLRHIRIRNLRVGPEQVDLVLERHAHDVGVQVERRSGPVDVRVAT